MPGVTLGDETLEEPCWRCCGNCAPGTATTRGTFGTAPPFCELRDVRDYRIPSSVENCLVLGTLGPYSGPKCRRRMVWRVSGWSNRSRRGAWQRSGTDRVRGERPVRAAALAPPADSAVNDSPRAGRGANLCAAGCNGHTHAGHRVVLLVQDEMQRSQMRAPLSQIPHILNQRGYRSEAGRPFHARFVCGLAHSYRLKRTCDHLRGPGRLTVQGDSGPAWRHRSNGKHLWPSRPAACSCLQRPT